MLITFAKGKILEFDRNVAELTELYIFSMIKLLSNYEIWANISI